MTVDTQVKMTTNSAKVQNLLNDDLCPFVRFPGSDCFCLNINSEHIDSINDFCVGHYLHCPLFSKNLKSRCWSEHLS